MPVGNVSPSPSPSPVASPASTPVPSASPLPSPGGSSQLPQDQYTCAGPDGVVAQYGKSVEEAQRKYVVDHPGQFKPGTECLYPTYWDGYYFEVVDTLNRLYPLEAIVDDCGGAGICGEIQVKAKGVKMGSGFSEGYSILISSGCIRHNYGGSFRGKCTPAWWNK